MKLDNLNLSMTKNTAKPTSIGSSNFLPGITIFICGLLIFLFLQNTHEFVGFESRFGLFAQEMLRHGISFFPISYQHFYPDYPATSTILIYWLSFFTGKQVTILSAVSPSAIASALTLTFIYLIGSLHDRRWGLLAVLLTLLVYAFVESARTIALDQFTTTACACSFWSVSSASYQQKNSNLLWLPIAWFLGFAFRGPIGLIIPASLVCGFYLLEKDWQKFILAMIASIVLLIISLSLLMTLAYIEGGHSFMKEVIAMQITQRIQNNSKTPFYFYLSTGFINYAICFPLAFIIVTKLGSKFFVWQKPSSQQFALIRHFLFWIFIVMLGMSIPAAKKIRYLLPITPALSLLSAAIFIDPLRSYFSRLRKLLLYFCEWLPFIILFAIVACYGFTRYQQLMPTTYIFNTSLLLVFIGTAGSLIRRKIANFEQQEITSIAIGSAAFLALYIGIIEPMNMSFNRATPFVQAVEKNRANKPLVFYKIGPDGDDIKYMVTANAAIIPDFLSDEQELRTYKRTAIFITEQNFFDQLPEDIKQQLVVIVRGNLGHTHCLAFRKLNISP